MQKIWTVLQKNGPNHLVGVTATDQAQLDQFFDGLDADGSGQLYLQELKDVLGADTHHHSHDRHAAKEAAEAAAAEAKRKARVLPFVTLMNSHNASALRPTDPAGWKHKTHGAAPAHLPVIKYHYGTMVGVSGPGLSGGQCIAATVTSRPALGYWRYATGADGSPGATEAATLAACALALADWLAHARKPAAAKGERYSYSHRSDRRGRQFKLINPASVRKEAEATSERVGKLPAG